MNDYYNKFSSLSDENLLRRIDRKESYQKEAVEAAYMILVARGYNLDYPFNEEQSQQLEIERRSSLTLKEWKALEHHLVFKKFFPRISLIKLFFFFLFFTFITILSNSGVTESFIYRKIHILSEQVISLGVISITFDLILIYFFFFFRNTELNSFKSFDSRKFLVGLKTFLILLICISVWELLFSDYFTLFGIFENKTYRIFLKELWFGIFVAFTEEFVFKWILLVQVLIRIPETKRARMLAFIIIGILFALSHIPIEISKYGSIQYGHQIQTFIFSYFSCIVFVRTRNFPLVAFLHFLMNISYIMFDGGSSFYFNWLLIFGMIYSIPSIFEHKLFRLENRKSYGPKWVYAVPFVIPTIMVFFVPKEGLDYYHISRNHYQIDEDKLSMIAINRAIELTNDNPKFYNQKGNVHYNFEEYDSAFYNYNLAVKLDSNFTGAIRNRGLVCKYVDKHSQGVNDLSRALEEGLVTARIYEHRGSCYKGLKEYDLALADFRESLRIKPYSSSALCGIGGVFLRMKEFDSCLVYEEKALVLNPKLVSAYELMSIAYSGLEKYDTSNYVMTKAIEMGSTHPARFYVRGNNYYRKEDYYRAIQEFDKALEINQNDKDIHAYLGYAYLFLDDYENGCEFLRTAADLGDEESSNDLNKYCD